MKKTKKKALSLVQTGVLLGVGANVTKRVGGSAQGIAAFGKFLPVAGTVAGAGMALDVLRPMVKSRKTRKRKK